MGVWSIQVDRDTLSCQITSLQVHATKTYLSGEPWEVGSKQTSVASLLPVLSPPKFRVRWNHLHRSWHLKERRLRERRSPLCLQVPELFVSPLCLQGTWQSSWAPFVYKDTAVCLPAPDFTSLVSPACTQPWSKKHILRENATFVQPLLYSTLLWLVQFGY